MNKNIIKRIKILAIFIILNSGGICFGQWGHPYNNYDVLQTWDDLWIYDDVEIKGWEKNLTLSNDAESESGIFFKDSQGPDQSAKILFDAGYEKLNFYIEGTNGSSSSDVLLQLTADRKVLVNGTFKAKGVFVQTNVWADYVFDENYNLMSLYSLEEYLKKNKHLPNVPSETEVIKNGIDVAKMDAILLRKIEELTLYIINQQKIIEKIEAELEKLKQ